MNNDIYGYPSSIILLLIKVDEDEPRMVMPRLDQNPKKLRKTDKERVPFFLFLALRDTFATFTKSSRGSLLTSPESTKEVVAPPSGFSTDATCV